MAGLPATLFLGRFSSSQVNSVPTAVSEGLKSSLKFPALPPAGRQEQQHGYIVTSECGLTAQPVLFPLAVC